MLKRFFIVLAIVLAAPHLSAQVNVQLEALKRLKDIDLDANPAIKKVVLDLLEASRGQAAFVEIVRDFKLRGHEAELLRYAQAHPNDSTGVEAIRLLLNAAGFKLIHVDTSHLHFADEVLVLQQIFQLEFLPAGVFEILVDVPDSLGGSLHGLIVARVENVEFVSRQQFIKNISVSLDDVFDQPVGLGHQSCSGCIVVCAKTLVVLKDCKQFGVAKELTEKTQFTNRHGREIGHVVLLTH